MMIKVGVVGGTGYTGVELLRLLAAHPGAELVVITSRSDAGQPVADMFPNLRGSLDIAFTAPDPALLQSCDLVFFATPNGIAMQQVPELLEAGVRVIDLAADFRIGERSVWEHWYGMQHACPELLADAVYGLPEVNREAVRNARLVANPVCYPTAVALGFLPLVEQGLIARYELTGRQIINVGIGNTKVPTYRTAGIARGRIRNHRGHATAITRAILNHGDAVTIAQVDIGEVNVTATA